MKKLLKPILITLVVLIVSGLLVIPALKNISYGIDLQGGFEILYNIEPLEEGAKLTQDDLDNTYKAIVNRIDTLGVSEPVIAFEGSNLIRIQLPGVSNEDEARERISTTAVLSFRDTDDNLLMTSDVLGRGGATVEYDQKNLSYAVRLDIKDSAKFYDVTSEIADKSEGDNLIVTWLDFNEETDSYQDYFESDNKHCGDGNMKCISAATVSEGISGGNVVITGSFTQEDANILAELINSGSLPTKLSEEATPRSVSPSFGSQTITKTGIAGLIAFALISLLIICKYRLSGLIGSICLFAYASLVFVIFNAVGGVLTLTGIAALVLGIGMAVDSIIVSNERVKDELSKGKKLIDAFNTGNKSSLVAIIDANVTTLIAGIVLYVFGESSVKGFATMLIITIFVTLFTTIFLYRVILKSFVKSKHFNQSYKWLFGNVKEKKERNYVKMAKAPLILSLAIIIIGSAFAIVRGFNFGVDFTGGTNINLTGEAKLNFEEIKEIVKEYDVRDYDTYLNSDKEGYIKLNDILTEEEEIQIKDELSKLNIETSVNEISTLVTNNLTKNAIKALCYSIIAIIIYIAIRFNINYAISGILMLIHDVLIVIALFSIFHISVDFIIVAALLTIVGYSINDTIVVFDRIRENRRKLYNNRKKLTNDELTNLVNISSTETISRNIWTSITTIIAVVVLLCVGLNDILTFNIAILIGLLAGSVSSLLIGPRVWMVLERRTMDKPEEDDDDDEVEELKVKGINY